MFTFIPIDKLDIMWYNVYSKGDESMTVKELYEFAKSKGMEDVGIMIFDAQEGDDVEYIVRLEPGDYYVSLIIYDYNRN
jgi:predicted homoserine dehydrogenase-like protein